MNLFSSINNLWKKCCFAKVICDSQRFWRGNRRFARLRSRPSRAPQPQTRGQVEKEADLETPLEKSLETRPEADLETEVEENLQANLETHLEAQLEENLDSRLEAGWTFILTSRKTFSRFNSTATNLIVA